MVTMETRILTVLLCLAASVCSGQLVTNVQTISVDIGRSVFLHPNTMRFAVPQGGDTCRVEVIADAMTQRVGTLEPKVFNCFFPPKSVQYIHNGNPLLKKDRVKVQVHHLMANDTVSQTLYLGVQIIDTPYFLVLTNHEPLRPVTVNRLSGQSNPIDHSVLRFRYHQGSANCTVGYSRHRNVWPLMGRIMHNYRGQQWREVPTFKWDCHDFMTKSLRYEHFGQPTPDVDYLPLTVEVSDPLMSRELLVERLYLPINIKKAFPNMPPKGSFMSMYIMEVDEFVLATVIPGVLSATDSETPAQSLVFNISKSLGEGQGYFVNLQDHARPISSFTQEEMNNNLIAYRPPSISYPDRMIYSVEFTVFDSHFVSSNPIMLDIAVRPSATNAPRVSVNKGLTLLEGQSRPIRLKNFQLVDNDNLDDVRIFIKGGIHHGHFTVHNKPAMMFTVADLRSRAVVYHHDDSNTITDFIDFRIMDGSHIVRTKLPINILPKDDSAPFLIANIGLSLKEGEVMLISDFELYAHDDDSEDDYIIYDVVTSPKHGEIIKMYRRTMAGEPVSTFYQAEISRGFIYYRHFGGEHFTDSFDIILQDRHSPPNVSPVQTVMVTINPVSDIAPQLVAGVTQSLDVLETEIALITENHLLYTDMESDDDDLMYTITSFPYFVNSRATSDAGRIVSVDGVTMLMKDPSLPVIRQFKQSHIRHRKIAYMPPIDEIGTKPRMVNFIYMVEDSGGNRVREQKFLIRVLPVNTQRPILQVRKLLLKEGTFAALTLNEVKVDDADTPADSLLFTLDVVPLHGHLMNGGVLEVGDNFTIDDLANRRIRYVHDGSESETDSYVISVTDGLHRSSQTVDIEITPVDDETPQLVDNLQSKLEVNEGAEVAITTDVLSATDSDTSVGEIYFLLVTSPKLGQVHRNGRMTTVFTQNDLQRNRITYRHTGGEIGPEPIQDSLTFLVSDKPVPSTDGLPMHDINVEILPVNNQRPRIELGTSIIVPEARKQTIAQEMLDVKDLDSVYREIEFIIERQPEWGFLENIKPSPGSEKSNAGKRIVKFKMADILDGTINYVQSVHKGVEPLSDNLVLYAFDGVNKSPQVILSVTIVPENDELPEGELHNLVVIEGGEVVLQGGMFDITDRDRPKNMLMVSLDQPPKHGKLMLRMYSRGTRNRVDLPMHDFEFDQLKTDMNLMYQHDGTEHFQDEFSLKISDGMHSVVKATHVNITSMNDEKPALIKNAGLHINFGDTAMISGLVLQTHDPDIDNTDVGYIITRLPRRGVLQIKQNDTRNIEMWKELKTGAEFTQKDVDMNRIRYVNTGAPSRKGTDKFQFRLTDGVNTSPHEVFEIQIKHSRKGEIAIMNKGLAIEEGERKVITPSSLSALDDTNSPDHLVFTITNQPLQGQLELSSEPGKNISTFSQVDILGSRLIYAHTSKADLPEDVFTFTVSNNVDGMEKNGVFVITIEPVDRVLPTLDHTVSLKVSRGTTAVITSEHLKASDPDTQSGNITFTISHKPGFGVVTKNGREVDRFTQADVNAGIVKYTNTKTQGSIDRFLFTIDDGHHQGFFISSELQKHSAMFNMLLESPESQPPELTINKSPEMLETFSRGKYGFIITNKNLAASDETSPDGGISYIITSPPRNGFLQHNTRRGGQMIGQRLKQQDINQGGVLYIVRDGSKATNDSFAFRLQDTSGHSSVQEYRFLLTWASLKFSRSEYIVCESAGVVSITILRTGNVNDSSFVEVAVRGSQAREGQDYDLGKVKQVQFSPGMTSSTYNIILKKDDLEESNEKIRLVLKSPVNTVLGEQSKTVVQIVNSVRGHCPYTPGIIGGDDPTFAIQPATVTREGGDIIRMYHGIVGAGQKREPLPGSIGYNGMKRKTEPKSGSDKKKRKLKRKLGKRKKSPKSERKNMECSNTMYGLIRHDPDNDKLYRCNGFKWKKWSPTASKRKLRKLDETGKRKKRKSKKNKCPKGWLGRRKMCYLPAIETKTWNEAHKFCKEEFGANLAATDSKKLKRWFFKHVGKKPYWIGLSNKHKENCTLVHSNKGWQQVSCTGVKARFVCAKEEN